MRAWGRWPSHEQDLGLPVAGFDRERDEQRYPDSARTLHIDRPAEDVLVALSGSCHPARAWIRRVLLRRSRLATNES